MCDYDLIRCSNCNKVVEWYDLGDHSNCICYDCLEKMNNNPKLWKKYNRKKKIRSIQHKLSNLGNKVFMRLFWIIFVGVWIGVACLWIYSCVGNLLNVDEDPAPGTHWRVDK